MGNLNAEQLVNLLEHCSKSKYCDGCTMRYNPRFLEARSFDSELVCGKVLIRWATELIKERTDENERLKARVLEENHLRHQAEEMLANGMSAVKADIVKKMHSKLCEGRVSNDNVVIVANQIAKEMLEGENDNLQQTKQS